MKQVMFHSDFAPVVVFVNGTPIAVHAEVDIVLKQPSKLSRADKQGWAQISKDSAAACSAEVIEAAQ